MRRAASRLAVAALAAAGLVPAAAAAAGDPVLPDLVADPPVQSTAPEVYDFGGGDQRLLLRFDGFVHNAGFGPLELDASLPDSGVMTHVVQRVFDADRVAVAELTPTPGPRVLFETADTHNHWHLRAAARYSLWDLDRRAEVAPGQKVGFCLIDVQRVDAHGSTSSVYRTSTNNFCQQRAPSAPRVVMGVSPGWRDIYGRQLYFQWVDVSSVQPGRYWLRNDVDPEHVIVEAAEDNQPGWATQESVVNGHVARPLDLGEVTGGSTHAITLGADTFDDRFAATPGPVRYRVETPPAHGTLSVATGQWFSDPQITYRPHAGYTGPDSFTYSARDADSPFPSQPARAPVTLSVAAPPEPSVTITGAPSTMRTGTTAQLGAIVAHAPNRVQWYVDGKPGGDLLSGTITQEGFYRAPLLVPSRGYVIVAAVQPDTGARGEARIGITSGLVLRSAVAPSFVRRPALRGARLARLALTRHGGAVVIGTETAVRGRLTIRVTGAGGRAKVCRFRAQARRPVACKVSLARLAGRRAAAAHTRTPVRVVRAVARLEVATGDAVMRRLKRRLR